MLHIPYLYKFRRYRSPMGPQEDFQKERIKIALKWGFPVVIGVITLIISTLLDLSDVLPNTPQQVFQILNGVSIALIVVFGIIWYQMEKKLQDRYGKSQDEATR
jgi:hypothetical protein